MDSKTHRPGLAEAVCAEDQPDKWKGAQALTRSEVRKMKGVKPSSRENERGEVNETLPDTDNSPVPRNAMQRKIAGGTYVTEQSVINMQDANSAASPFTRERAIREFDADGGGAYGSEMQRVNIQEKPGAFRVPGIRDNNLVSSSSLYAEESKHEAGEGNLALQPIAPSAQNETPIQVTAEPVDEEAELERENKLRSLEYRLQQLQSDSATRNHHHHPARDGNLLAEEVVTAIPVTNEENGKMKSFRKSIILILIVLVVLGITVGIIVPVLKNRKKASPKVTSTPRESVPTRLPIPPTLRPLAPNHSPTASPSKNPHLSFMSRQNLTDAIASYAAGGRSKEIIMQQYGPMGDWDVSKIQDFSLLFYGMSFFNEDISRWNVSSATTMSSMFGQAKHFNQDLSLWNVGKVEDMSYMFLNASSFNQNLSVWDTRMVTNMNGMFWNAFSFNQDLSLWDTGKVSDMNGMFVGAIAFNGDISTWDTSGVTDMGWMFSANDSLKFGASSDPPISVFNQDISLWDVSKVTVMSEMFAGAWRFNQDLSSWNTSSCHDMAMMFFFASSFNGNISTWDTSQVTSPGSMYSMFSAAAAFNQDLSRWNVSGVTNMEQMFALATSFNQDLSAWNMSRETDVSLMFNLARSFNQNLCSWGNTLPKNASVSTMFSGSSCPVQSDPNLTAALPGPFCYACG